VPDEDDGGNAKQDDSIAFRRLGQQRHEGYDPVQKHVGDEQHTPCSMSDLWHHERMIIGAHSIIYSSRPEADRAFLRDVLKLSSVDVGSGWLIFGLPPAEVAVHPSEEDDIHEFYLMCDDVAQFVAEMGKHNITCGPIQNQGWGLLTRVTLPSGGKLGVYQPRHARPKAMTAGSRRPAKPRKKKSIR
jgi:hypothetical protein